MLTLRSTGLNEESTSSKSTEMWGRCCSSAAVPTSERAISAFFGCRYSEGRILFIGVQFRSTATNLYLLNSERGAQIPCSISSSSMSPC